MKTLTWWVICLISHFGSFEVCVPNLSVPSCLLDFFFPELACFAKTEKLRQKFLLFFKIYHDIKISVLKMVPVEFPGVHFLPLLSINQTHCRLVGVLATKYRIRHSETFLWASKASHRSWTLILFHKQAVPMPWPTISLILLIFPWG